MVKEVIHEAHNSTLQQIVDQPETADKPIDGLPKIFGLNSFGDQLKLERGLDRILTWTQFEQGLSLLEDWATKYSGWMSLDAELRNGGFHIGTITVD